MNHTNFLSHILSTTQAQRILKNLKQEVHQDLIWILKEAHTWGYFHDFPDLEEEILEKPAVKVG